MKGIVSNTVKRRIYEGVTHVLLQVGVISSYIRKGGYLKSEERSEKGRGTTTEVCNW